MGDVPAAAGHGPSGGPQTVLLRRFRAFCAMRSPRHRIFELQPEFPRQEEYSASAARPGAPKKALGFSLLEHKRQPAASFGARRARRVARTDDWFGWHQYTGSDVGVLLLGRSGR